MNIIPNVNDGSDQPPRLAVYLNMGTLSDLPDWSAAPRAEGKELLAAIRDAGFDGTQGGDVALSHELGLGTAGGGRLYKPEDAEDCAKNNKDAGHPCATVHAGWGLEDDAEVDAYVDAVIHASVKHDIPIYIETHRATITQDIWRTVQITQRFPGVRFNGDFSHWYTGLEMRYGTVERKLDFAQPVFDRIRFLHGRIGNAGSMQVTVGDTLDDATSRDYVQDFMEMWTRSMVGFLDDAQAGDVLVMAPELLQPAIFYGRAFPDAAGSPREECDRWAQALIYKDIAKACFAAAQQRVGAGS